jgi:hypothetical protein
VKLRAEEVDPEIPVHVDPQEALADAYERGHLRDRIRPRKKRLAGALKPRSWRRVKLMM